MPDCRIQFLAPSALSAASRRNRHGAVHRCAAPLPTGDDRPPAAGGRDVGIAADWFTHLGGTMSYGGVVIDRYLAWHPIDHIRWELARPAPGGGAAEGARFRIVEAFGGRPQFKVDVVDRVEKLDATGIRLVQRIAGVVVFQLEHTWSAGSDGVHYVSVMDVGRAPACSRRSTASCAGDFPTTCCVHGRSTTSKKWASWNTYCRS